MLTIMTTFIQPAFAQPAVYSVGHIYEGNLARGTGFVFGRQGDVMSCSHLLDDTASVITFVPYGKASGSYRMHVVYWDTLRDLMVLRSAAPMPIPPLMAGPQPQPGDSLTCYGLEVDTINRQPIFALDQGMVLRTGRIKVHTTVDFLEFYAPNVNFGWSGGPVLDSHDRIIGMLTSSTYMSPDKKQFFQLARALAVTELIEAIKKSRI